MQPIISSFSNSQAAHDSSIEFKAWNEVVKVLQAKGLSNNFNVSWSPLYAAVLLADLELCKRIVEMGFPINRSGIFSETPLYQAIYPDKEEIALYLIEKGADVRTTDQFGNSYLHFAVEHSLPQVVDALIQRGACINACVVIASPHPDFSCAKYTGAEEPYVVVTPLYLALRQEGKPNSQQIAIALIRNGADISYRGPNGFNFLHLATYKGYEEVCKLLVEKGMDVNQNLNAGPSKEMTPLHFSVTKDLEVKRRPVNSVLNNQLLRYRKLMDSLIDEKPGITSESKAQKKEKICNLANTCLTVEGDEAFKQTIQHYIEKIAELKPGRKLIKALAKNSKENTRIWSGVETKFGFNRFTLKDLNIEVDRRDTYARAGYKTINDKLEVRVCQFSQWIIFAHELVHALHHHLDINKAMRATDTTVDILDGMDDLGEQHAVTGFNHLLFELNENIDKVDVLCENVFSLALGLPPRTNHQGYTNWNPLAIDLNCFKEKNVKEIYYEWLEKELNLIRSIPIDKEEDKDFIFEYLKKYPLAIESLPEKIKADKEFCLQLVKMDWYRLKHFPILWKDRDVMLEAIRLKPISMRYLPKEFGADKEVMHILLEAIKKRPFNSIYVPKEFFADKEFVLNLLKIVKEDFQDKELVVLLIKSHLAENLSLKNDPEINEYL